MKSKFSVENIDLKTGKSIYFASDFHLGTPDEKSSREREKQIVQWLEQIKSDAQIVFLVGDIFDFWFEYKYVVPKGYIRLLGKLAELADSGVRLILFTGNHDMWMRDYFKKELGADVHRNPVVYQIRAQGQDSVKSFFVGHGDGLGPGDPIYKQLKKVFESPLSWWAFRQVHPDFGGMIATRWSRSSRAANNHKGEESFLGEDREWLFQYCLEMEKHASHDYYIFGHRHLPLDLQVNSTARYINLGEWVSQQKFARYDGTLLSLLDWRSYSSSLRMKS